MKNKIDVSLVIPAYNEEASLGTLLWRVEQILKDTKLNYEIIIVNDGSKDATSKVAADYSMNNSKIKLLSYNINQGKGHAITQGFKCANGDAVVFIDSDLDIVPQQINSYIQALKYGDLVISSKYHPKSVVKVPLLRKFLSYAFSSFVKLLTGLQITDTQTGLKAVRKTALEPVFSVLTVRRFAFDVELLAVSNLYGLKIIEMPVNIHLSNSLFSPIQVWKMFIDLLGISYRLRISKSYQKTYSLNGSKILNTS